MAPLAEGPDLGLTAEGWGLSWYLDIGSGVSTVKTQEVGRQLGLS